MRRPAAATTVPTRLRRPLARVLQVVAVVGAIVALAVGIVGWRVVGAVDDVAVQSTAITADALTTLEETLTLAADLVGSVDTTLVALEEGLGTTAASVTEGTEALDSVSQLAGDAGPALASATRTLRTLEQVGTSIDSALGGLAALPLAPDYDPEQGLGATAGQLADDLEPLGETFATTARDLEDVVDSSDDLEQDLADLHDAVQEATTQLAASEQLIDDYRATADRASRVSGDLGGGLDVDLALLRILLLLGGVVFALGQVVPWVLADTLLDASHDPGPPGPMGPDAGPRREVTGSRRPPSR